MGSIHEGKLSELSSKRSFAAKLNKFCSFLGSSDFGSESTTVTVCTIDITQFVNMFVRENIFL